MIRVFLADDHPVVLAGLRYLFSLADDITVVGEASDGRKLLLAAEAPGWPVDVLVLDLSLPQVNGIEVLSRLHKTRPALPILVLSMHAEDQYARRLRALGAAGYVAKDRSDEELITAIRAVSQGRHYFSRPVDRGSPAREAERPHEGLSARQFQVFSLLVAGSTVSEIAAELNLGISTVSTHLGHVKDKLGARTVADLMRYAHRMKLD